MKKYFIENLKILCQLFVSKSLFLVTEKYKYKTYEYHGKWVSGKYSCDVFEKVGTLDEIVAIIVGKF